MPNYSKTNAKKLMSSMFGSFLAILPIACGPDVQKSAPTKHEGIEGLRILYEERLEAYEFATTDRSGWPSHSDCDGLLFASLASYSGATVDLTLAEYAPGEWHRRPAPSCFNKTEGDVGSKSTISNDMITGLLAGLYRQKDLAAAHRFADYVEANDFIMGEPYPEMASRVVLKRNGKSLLGKIIKKLSDGKDVRDYADLTPIYLPVFQDYEKHIQTIGILLHGELDNPKYNTTGTIDVTDMMYGRLEANHKADPNDAFIAAVLGLYSGDLETPTKLLLSPDYVSPTYVRPRDGLYPQVHWLLAARVVLDHAEGL